MTKFEKGNIVKLVGFDKSYTVTVTNPSKHKRGFEGVVIESDYDRSEYGGACSVGYLGSYFENDAFELVD